MCVFLCRYFLCYLQPARTRSVIATPIVDYSIVNTYIHTYIHCSANSESVIAGDTIALAQLRFLQEEHAILLVAKQFDDGTTKLLQTLYTENSSKECNAKTSENNPCTGIHGLRINHPAVYVRTVRTRSMHDILQRDVSIA